MLARWQVVSGVGSEIFSAPSRWKGDKYCQNQRLNMELDLQTLFGLHVHRAQVYSLAETPQPSPLFASFGLIYEGTIGRLLWRHSPKVYTLLYLCTKV
jgi:hypothetical protein